MFEIVYSKRSGKFLKNCDKSLQKRILQKIELLKVEPVPHDAKKVQGNKGDFRVRIGDYRILYELNWDKKVILVADIDKRSKVYK